MSEIPAIATFCTRAHICLPLAALGAMLEAMPQRTAAEAAVGALAALEPALVGPREMGGGEWGGVSAYVRKFAALMVDEMLASASSTLTQIYRGGGDFPPLLGLCAEKGEGKSTLELKDAATRRSYNFLAGGRDLVSGDWLLLRIVSSGGGSSGGGFGAAGAAAQPPPFLLPPPSSPPR